nr:hypothetical protein [Tanacetum cinerariifolium]
DVLIVFFAQFLDINPRSGVSFSRVVCRFRDSCHKESCVCHYTFFSKQLLVLGPTDGANLLIQKPIAATLGCGASVILGRDPVLGIMVYGSVRDPVLRTIVSGSGHDNIRHHGEFEQ